MKFEETMRGTLRNARGELPIEFTVTARSEGRGFFALDGTATAPGYADRAPATGSLFISLLGGVIRYRLHFADGLTLEAQKTPSIFSPIRSMTWMPAKLLDRAGATVAEGEMTFALADLPGFVLSALPAGR